MLGSIIRNSAQFTNVISMKSLYFAYVRSRVEYCAVVWSPYYIAYKHDEEMVQTEFLKYIYFKVHNLYSVRGYCNDLPLQGFNIQSRLCGASEEKN